MQKRIGWLILCLLCVSFFTFRIYILDWEPPVSGLGRMREALITGIILLMATAGFYYRWGYVLFCSNIGALLGDFPAGVSGASKLEVVTGLMLYGFLIGLLIEGLRKPNRSRQASKKFSCVDDGSISRECQVQSDLHNLL